MRIQEAINQTRFNSNVQKALINVIFTSNWLRDIHNEVFKEHQLLLQHYNILRIVNGQHPKSTSPSYIKSVILDKGPDLTRLVNKMVSLGLFKRVLNEKNRRQVEISITAKGIELAEILQTKLAEKMNQKIGLSEIEAEQLSILLDKMRTA